jgi:hypothetical protein
MHQMMKKNGFKYDYDYDWVILWKSKKDMINQENKDEWIETDPLELEESKCERAEVRVSTGAWAPKKPMLVRN